MAEIPTGDYVHLLRDKKDYFLMAVADKARIKKLRFWLAVSVLFNIVLGFLLWI